jgi:hypothetical protein
VEEKREQENAASNSDPQKEEGKEAEEKAKKNLSFIENRGKVTEDFCRSPRKIEAPYQPVLTLRKLKTMMPSLKPSVDHRVRSHVVYCIKCPRCSSCYVSMHRFVLQRTYGARCTCL